MQDRGPTGCCLLRAAREAAFHASPEVSGVLWQLLAFLGSGHVTPVSAFMMFLMCALLHPISPFYKDTGPIGFGTHLIN